MDQKCGNIIYQLGVLILELITGQSSDGTGADLIKWIQGTNFARSMNKMIDPDLGNSFDYKDVRNLLSIAKLCIKSREKPRFSIPQIFRYLQSKVDVTSYQYFLLRSIFGNFLLLLTLSLSSSFSLSSSSSCSRLIFISM